MYIRLFLLCFVFKFVCGDDIAQRLIDRYNDLRNECYDEKKSIKPAFQCSGLIIRGLAKIGSPKQMYAWSKKESNIRKNAFSAAFLRRDQQFNGFAHGYDSGFIYYPHLETPSNKYSYRVYCAFPIDAHTDFRGGPHGCGEYYKDPSGKSADCESQGIINLPRWTKHFRNLNKKQGEDYRFGRFQCGFDMTSRKSAARNFALIIEVKKWLRHASRKYAPYHNELVIRAWNENHPEKLPIEAFFYMLESNEPTKNPGREKAFMYQSDYLKLTNETIPVVGIRFPSPDDPDLHVELDENQP